MKFASRALRRIPMVGIWSLSIIAVGAASATAGGMISGAQVSNGSLSGADLKDGSIGFGDLSVGAKNRIINNAVRKAKTSNPGSANAAAPGVNGKNGTNGTNGTDGAPGLNGKDAPAAEYGIGALWLKRGSGAYGAWGHYASPAIPSMAGVPAMAGGELRFTCSQPTCGIALTGVIASDSSTTDGKVQVHLQVERTGPAGNSASQPSSGPTEFCEASEVYARSTPRIPMSQAGMQYVTKGAGLLQSIGGSYDCGGGAALEAANADTDASLAQINVTEFIIPQGYYNITPTFRFYK